MRKDGGNEKAFTKKQTGTAEEICDGLKTEKSC